MWTAEVVLVDSFVVSVLYTEDVTGESIQDSYPVPKGVADDWLEDVAARRIVELSARTSLSKKFPLGPVTPKKEILEAAGIVVREDLPLFPNAEPIE